MSSSVSAISCHNVYLSYTGVDDSSCGLVEKLPCRNVDYALKNIVKNDDILLIDGGANESFPYVYLVNQTHDLMFNITLVGWEGFPILSTLEPEVSFLFRSSIATALSVSRIHFHGIGLLTSIASVTVDVSDCYFKNISSSVLAMTFVTNYTIFQSHLAICNCKFTLCGFIFYGTVKDISILIENSEVIGYKNRVPNCSGLELSTVAAANVMIQIRHSDFYHLSPALDMYPVETPQSVSVCFQNSSFVKNYNLNGGGALTMVRMSAAIVRIQDCHFELNRGYFGAALHFAGIQDISIEESVFISNIVTDHGGACFFENSHVEIKHTSFANNTASGDIYYHDFSQQSGYGGAISSTKDSTVMITYCNFSGNSASIFGGSIYHVGDHSYLKLSASTFSGPFSKQLHALQGDILYSTSAAYIGGCSFKVQSNVDQELCVVHHTSSDAEHPLALQMDFGFHCAPSQVLRSIVDKKYPIATGQYLYLFFYCDPCPNGFYTLDTSYKLRVNATYWNGSNAVCKPCPPGGVCSGNLRSAGNFWGFTNSDLDVSFIACPYGYCCNGQLCTSYQSCSPRRFGRLCSQCKPGFCEGLFSSHCVSDHNCGVAWFIPAVLVICFLYVIILMYLGEVVGCFRKALTCLMQLKMDASIQLSEPLVAHSHDNDGTIVENVANMIQDASHDVFHDELTGQEDSQQTMFSGASTEESIDRGTAPYSKNEHSAKSVLSGVLKILVFFYQGQLLIKVQSELERSQDFPEFMKEVLSSIYNFKWTGAYTNIDVCLFSGLRPVAKELLKSGFVFLMVFIILFLHLCYKVLLRFKHLDHKESTLERPLFPLRLRCCYLQVLLFGYATLSACSLNMINCIEIQEGGEVGLYLYLDARFMCFSSWQYVAILVTAFWTVPFFISLYIGGIFLRRRFVTVNEFLAMVSFPPISLFYVFRWCRDCHVVHVTYEELTHMKKLCLVLDEPFIKCKPSEESLNWECVLIFRRLLLVFISIFVNNPIARLYLMIVPLICYLVHHLAMQPYNRRYLNWLETVSLTMLLVLASINLFWAYNYLTHVPLTPIIEAIAQSFLIVESCVLLLPLLMLMLVFIVFIIKHLMKCLH